MSAWEDPRGAFGMDYAQAVINRIADIAEAFAQQAGVGGMETAGNIISYLAEHPRDTEPLLKFGIMELPADWHSRGRLTWHAANGKIVRPEVARRARVIKQMEHRGNSSSTPIEEA